MFDHFKKMQSLAAFEKKGTKHYGNGSSWKIKSKKSNKQKKTNESI